MTSRSATSMASLVAFSDELEKTAVLSAALTALKAMGVGIAGHLGVNTGILGSRTSTNLGEVLAHKGFQHGLTEAAVNPAMVRSLHALGGPEAMETYHRAREAGKRLSVMDPVQRQLTLTGLYGAENPALSNAPILGDLKKAIMHEYEGTSPTLTTAAPEGGFVRRALNAVGSGYAHLVDKATNVVDRPFDTKLQRGVRGVIGVAPMAGALAVDAPGAVAHMGWNTAREVAGRSSLGDRFVRHIADEGLHGRTVSPRVEALTNMLVSPAALDPMRAGTAIRNAVAPMHITPGEGASVGPVLDYLNPRKPVYNQWVKPTWKPPSKPVVEFNPPQRF